MNTDLERYRADAMAWLATRAAQFGRAARRGLSEAEDLALGRRWQAEKFAAGYAAVNWPKEHSGQGLGALEKLAFEQEEMKHSFPNDYFAVSLGMPVPIMLRYVKNDWANARATRALNGDEIWCNSFPNRLLDPTWPGCAPALTGKKAPATGSSTARSCGPLGRNMPIMA